MPQLTPFLWFNRNLNEAVNFYRTVFGDQIKIIDQSAGPAGSLMSATMEIYGQRLLAFDGGPQFEFSPAISLFIQCQDQTEVDQLWEGLSAGGKQSNCGWVRDRFGLSWQVVPAVLGKLLKDPDCAKAQRVMQAMLKMQKLEIALLCQAAESPAISDKGK